MSRTGRTGLVVTGSGVIRTVAVTGALDATREAEVSALLDRVVEPEVRHVVVDLTEVDFIDAAGVRTLVRAHHTAAGRGASLTVRNAGERVRWVLDLTGASRVLGRSDPPPA